jgi:hypothetical protein
MLAIFVKLVAFVKAQLPAFTPKKGSSGSYRRLQLFSVKIKLRL